MAVAMTSSHSPSVIATLFEQLRANIEDINACVRNLHEIKHHDESMIQLESQRSSYSSQIELKHKIEDDEIAAKRAAEDEARRKEREDHHKTFVNSMEEDMVKLEEDIAAKLDGGHVDLQSLLGKRMVSRVYSRRVFVGKAANDLSDDQ